MKQLILIGLMAISLSVTSCHDGRTEQLKRIADKIDTTSVPVKKVIEERVLEERRIEGEIVLGNNNGYMYKVNIDSIEYLVVVKAGDGGVAIIKHSK